MRLSFVAALCVVGLAAGANAAPYGWFPGSTVLPADPTGDKVVIVDLATNTLVTPAGGWDYTSDSPGADPFVPGFSPDGSKVFLVNGGDGDAGQPDGHIYVYDTANVISSLLAAGTPDAPIDTVTIVSDDEDAIEPTGFTVSPLGDRGYLMDAKDKKLHIFSIAGNGELSLVKTITGVGEKPSPVWLTANGQKAYFCSFVSDVPRVNVVQTNVADPVINTTVPLAMPAKTDVTFGFASVGFPMPNGSSTTVVPFPADTPVSDGVLTVFSGWAGFHVSSVLGDTYINDPVNIYRLNTATDTLQNSGNPVVTVNPASDQVVFPPLVHEFGVDRTALIGGSILLKEDNSTDRLRISTGAADNLMPGLGQRSPNGDKFFVGSLSAADGLAYLNTQTYTPVRTSSILYSHTVPTSARATQDLVALTTIARSTCWVLGYTDTSVVVAGSDTFFVARPDGVGTDGTGTDPTLCVLYNMTTQAVSTLNLGLVSGAYGQQPVSSGNAAPTVAITSPASNQTVSVGTPTLNFTGTASDSDGTVASVKVRINGGAFEDATGTTSWSYLAFLSTGANTVEVKAIDDDGTESALASRTITRLAFDPVDLLVLTPFTDVWQSQNDTGSFPAASRMAFTGFRHEIGAKWKTSAIKINTDGRTDLGTVTEFGELWTAQATSAPSFNAPAKQSSGWVVDEAQGRSVFFPDIDADGDSDVLQSDADGTVDFSFNNDGNIPAAGFGNNPNVRHSPLTGKWLFVADFNDDSRDDLLELDNAQGATKVSLSSGTSYPPASSTGTTYFRHDPSGGYGVVVGDYNGDNQDDIACVTPGGVWVALWTGSAFGTPTLWGNIGFQCNDTIGANGWWVVAGNVDNDGDDDLIQLTDIGHLWVSKSNGSSSFGAPTFDSALGFLHKPGGPWQVFVGNVN